MTDRYDICTGRDDRDGKTRWTKIGVMFPAKSGDGFAIKLDALPLPNKDGDVWIKAFVPQPRDTQEAVAQVNRQRPTGIPERPQVRGGSAPSLDDDVPFRQEWR